MKFDRFCRKIRVRDRKNNSKDDVNNYFQHKRWQLVTLFEQLSGYWPYQNRFRQYPLQFTHSFFLFTIFLVAANKSRDYVGVDIDIALECWTFMAFIFALFVKLIFASLYQCSRRMIYERIAKHFETIVDPEEATSLNEAAERGFQHTLHYMRKILILVVIFNSVPVLRSFYDSFISHHELRVQLPVPMNYGFDHDEYWYIIVLDFILWACSGILVNFTYDLSFTLQVQHVKALFEIVGIRLRKISKLVDEFENKNTSGDAADESYSLISSAIDLHSECLELVKQIEESYTINWFIILLLSTIGFSAGIHMITAKVHDPIEACRYILVFLIIVLHFQVIFSRGQIIINSSSKISYACYECKWYYLPKKSCKLLSMMMIRTSIPCQLTGAKLFPLSMESFSTMLKAGLSYYTVFQT